MNDASHLASATTLKTWKGLTFAVRPARPEDTAVLTEFFRHVSPEDRRFRFLSGSEKVARSQVEQLVAVDHEQTHSFLAFDGEVLIGTAMLAADPGLQRAEVAISLRADYKNRGVGWTLLDHLAHHAKALGIQRIEAVESRQNREALAVEVDMGFKAEPVPDDPTLVLVSKDLA